MKFVSLLITASVSASDTFNGATVSASDDILRNDPTNLLFYTPTLISKRNNAALLPAAV
jgi:hypothetical protein